ncbi:MAG: FecR domain-containing protein [SAR324 cluster bacterium]|nr:FecR domain-containing protein [SAR324 cluster bacterium]MBL7034602.1 FecR domain-containing protein [SAR324 cluster bacterium]
MRIFLPFKSLFFIVCLGLTATLVFAQGDAPAIATLLELEGSVETITSKSTKGRWAKNGILLYAGDTVRTSDNSKATVVYRDGSRIRLFQNSELLLKLSEEQSTSRRTFKFKLNLKNGALRGRFLKGLQRTTIRTPTALIGIKGTSFRITEKNNTAYVSLTEGLIEVSNLSSKTILNPGQWLENFKRSDDLVKKVAQIPNILNLKTEEYELDFSDGKSKQLKLSVQLQHSISGNILKRSGKVQLESDYYAIRLPNRFNLNSKGYARVLVKIDPPLKAPPEFKGLITLSAFIDDEGYDDVAEGTLVFKIRNIGKRRTLLLDPDKGLIEKRD